MATEEYKARQKPLRPALKHSLSLISEHSSVESQEAPFYKPELPAITEIRSALSRQRVCKGISYILPVNRAKLSTENVYQPNLRTLFSASCSETPDHFNENKLLVSAKNLLNPIAKCVVASDDALWETTKLNHSSDKVRRHYLQSIPKTGASESRIHGGTDLTRQRSSLFAPLAKKHTLLQKAAVNDSVTKLSSVEKSGANVHSVKGSDRHRQSSTGEEASQSQLLSPEKYASILHWLSTNLSDVSEKS